MTTLFRRILVPVDFSAGAKHALDLALELADVAGAEITILHVWYAPEYVSPSIAVHGFHGPEETLAAHVEREAKAELERFLAGRTLPKGTKIEFAFGNPAELIAERGRAHDLIVMNTVGRSGLRRLVVGSVAEGVMRRATVPVLVTKGGGAA